MNVIFKPLSVWCVLAQLREAQAEGWRARWKPEFVSNVYGLPVAWQPLPHANLLASLKTNPLLDFPGGWEIPWAEKQAWWVSPLGGRRVGRNWWLSGKESALQCRGQGFNPCSGKIPHAAVTKTQYS